MSANCLHTHTEFCDGKGSVEAFCQAAYAKGLSALGFSAHAPITKKTGLKTDWHLADERLDEYIDTVNAARRLWAGKLPVYLGLEVDYIKGLSSPADKDFQSLGLDYIIGSVHYVFPPAGGEPFTVDDEAAVFEREVSRHFSGDGEAVMEAYWDAVEGMISQGGFDILGHLDLIRKNNPRGEYFNPQGERYRRRIRQIAPKAARSGAVVEVNTGGINRGKTADPYPSRELLALLRAAGARVTITADAHEPDHLGGGYDTAREILLRAGYTETVEFEGPERGWTAAAI
ncbi:histidinol-phosphatase [Spirochaetia bacterium]|nr:histidinol-phosphatase [Spirochaetia bacterium]